MKKFAAVLISVIIAALLAVVGISACICLDNSDNIAGTDKGQGIDESVVRECKEIAPQCVLVLGCAVWEGNQPSPMLKDRLDTAIALYREGAAPRLLLSGDNRVKEYDEPDCMLKYTLEQGVPEEDIFVDYAGFSTYDSVYRAKAIFKIDRMIVVTQKYHLFRALDLCNALGITAKGAAAGQKKYTGRFNREAREVLARDKDLIKGIIKPKPALLGDEIPIEGESNASGSSDESDIPVVAIAWSNNQESYSFRSTLETVEKAGAEPVVLDMVESDALTYEEDGDLAEGKDSNNMLESSAAKQVKRSGWRNSNAEEVMEDIDCIIFPGGADVSPTLYRNEQKWHGIENDTDYSAERDVSDYLLMSYCIDNDIPTLCICRGMQMLSVVSGADMAQDIGQWFSQKGVKYTGLHRDPEKKDLVPHEVDLTSDDSLLYEMVGVDRLTGCPSWHHQAVKSVKGTRLKVTAYTRTDGIKVIEGVERKDKDFIVGLQFHPEVAVRKVAEKEDNAGDFMDYDTALSFFTELIEEGREEEREAA